MDIPCQCNSMANTLLQESDCDGYSDACNVTLLLNVVNDTPHTLEVTSRDLTTQVRAPSAVNDTPLSFFVTQRRDVEVVHFASEAERRACDPSPGVVIVKLGEGQELKLRAFASIVRTELHDPSYANRRFIEYWQSACSPYASLRGHIQI